MRLKKARMLSAILVASMLLNTTGMTVLAESNSENTSVELEMETSVVESTEKSDELEEGAVESEDEIVEETATVATTEETTVENASSTVESEEQQTSEASETETAVVEETTTEVGTTEASIPNETEERTDTEEGTTTEVETTTEEEITTEVETEEETTTEEVTETEEETTTEDETDELFPGLPESYTLSTKQLEDKLTLAEHADEISDLEDDAGNTNAYVKGEVVYLTESREDALAVAEGFGGELESYGEGVAVIKLGEKRTVSQAIKAASSKAYNLPAVWPNYYYKLFEEYNDPALKENSPNYQWVHEYVGDKYAWDKGYTGAGVKIGIIDTGVYSIHEDLSDNVRQNLSMVSENGAVATTVDPNGHGTHVAGIAASVGGNGKGGAGIAPAAQIYAYSVMDSSGIMADAYILRAINRAVSDGIDVVNMSLGSGYYSKYEEEVIEKAYKAGVAIFAAAGNEATNGYEYPASYKNVCSVAAIMQDGSKAGFTNYGDKIDLAFPGVDIFSTYNSSNQAYAFLQGTSMACPAAVGTAAVILSADVDAIKGKSGKDKVDALFSVMKKNAIKSSSSQMGAGTTYLPKVLGIEVTGADAAPKEPRFNDENVSTFKTASAEISVECDSYNASIYYSTNGKKPVLKNGVVTNGILLDSEGKVTITGAKQVTLNAIAVNHATGKSSKVVTKKYKLEPAPTSIEITSADSVKRLAKGKNITLSAVVEPSYAVYTGVKWSVGGSGVTVNNKGKVVVSKDASAGEYVIQATAGDITANFTLTVIDAVKIKKVKFANSKATMYTEDSLDLVGGAESKNITVETIDGKKIEGNEALEEVVWSSNNKKVASVDGNGKVTALAPGKAVIKAMANDGSKKSASCTITVKQLATSITLKGPEKIAVGKSATIKASIAPANVSNKKLAWAVSPKNNVTVNANGKVSVKAGASGIYKVTATETGVPEGREPKTASIQFEAISNPITKIELPKTVNLFTVSGYYDAPREMQLPTNVTGGDSRAIEYTSSAPGIATVDSNGLVVARSSGKTTITCSATDGSNKKATCSVVVSVPMSRIAIVPKNGNEGIVSVGSKITLSAKVSNNFGKAANQKVKWSIISGGQYATVDQKGIVKGTATSEPKSINQVVIKAEAVDESGASAVYTVFVIPKVTKFEVMVSGIDFLPVMTLGSDGKVTALSYGVDIKGAKNIGYQSDQETGGFWLVPKDPTTNRSSGEIVASGYVYNKEIQKVTVTVTLKDGSNRKVTKQTEYIYTSDGKILTLK